MKILFATLALAAATALHAAPTTLLNVSYDVTREFYKDYDDAFTKHWKADKNTDITIEQSHAGSSKQARAVVDGLQADVVTMNQDTDIDLIAKAGLIAPDWRTRLPDHAAPYTSTIVFLVRKGNPKGIEDWSDLVEPGVEIIIPNPKTSGNGRYSYLAAWAYAKAAGKDPQEFVAALFKNVPVLPAGGRDATSTFVQRGVGDVLLTFESETLQIARVFSPNDYDIVTPSSSILAESPVSVVDKVVDKRGTREVATEYLKYLWSHEGQQLAVKYFFRPREESLLTANAKLFPALKLYTIDEVFGGWSEAQKHFKDGGTFDAIYQPR
ncbi:MAG TPA: sulfate ABC transporter substrate-binding protein [Chthoniobacterales bacterium]|jgi:sulfate transport system substrate-binding protein